MPGRHPETSRGMMFGELRSRSGKLLGCFQGPDSVRHAIFLAVHCTDIPAPCRNAIVEYQHGTRGWTHWCCAMSLLPWKHATLDKCPLHALRQKYLPLKGAMCSASAMAGGSPVCSILPRTIHDVTGWV